MAKDDQKLTLFDATLKSALQEQFKVFDYLQNQLKPYQSVLFQELGRYQEMAERINKTMEPIRQLVNLKLEAENRFKNILGSTTWEQTAGPERMELLLPSQQTRTLSPDEVDLIAEALAEKIFKRHNTAKKFEKIIRGGIELPTDTHWENLTLKFKDQYDLDVWCNKEFIQKVTHEDLGCSKTLGGAKIATKDWGFLSTLSIQNGSFDLNTIVGNKEKEKYRQYKTTLSAKLKKFFSIDDDPFYNTKEKGSYRTKFHLDPEPQLRGDGELYGMRDADTDIYYDDLKQEISEEIDHKSRAANRKRGTRNSDD